MLPGRLRLAPISLALPRMLLDRERELVIDPALPVRGMPPRPGPELELEPEPVLELEEGLNSAAFTLKVIAGGKSVSFAPPSLKLMVRMSFPSSKELELRAPGSSAPSGGDLVEAKFIAGRLDERVGSDMGGGEFTPTPTPPRPRCGGIPPTRAEECGMGFPKLSTATECDRRGLPMPGRGGAHLFGTGICIGIPAPLLPYMLTLERPGTVPSL